jgi:membrane-associated protease RseP (regulator of RpoE activity)
MVSFVVYDIIFLVLFTLFVFIFLYTRKHNLQRQGILYLYRTKWGLKLIDWTAKKFAPILRPSQYVILASGYALMVIMVWHLIKFSYFYLTSPIAAKALKIPVLMPLIPYLPELFKIDFLPPFYFTYWIIIIAIIAIPHEFAHGIYARLANLKVVATGFGFLGPFLAAFVEPDEKQMAKAKKFPQLSILAAGTFANVLTTILFGILLWLFFVTSFTAAGINFNTYSSEILNTSSITEVSGIPIENFDLDSLGNSKERFVPITSNGVKYHASPYILEYSLEAELPLVMGFHDSPALTSKLKGSITHINDVNVLSFQDLSDELGNYRPGEEVTITTADSGISTDYTLNLSERNNKSFLGIGIIPPRSTGLSGKFYSFISSIKDPLVYYESNLGNFGIFVFDLLWWIVIVCISVALVNMLPVGIFDGGRFFYLTVWAITGSEKIGQKAFALSTWFFLLLVLALMIKWALIFV